MAIDKVGHVKAQIASQSGKLRPKDGHDSVKICCPYHGGGNERTPSCSVNLTGTGAPVGYFYCFGCKHKGSWNELANTLHLQGFKASDQVNDVFAFSFTTEDASATRLEKYRTLEPYEAESGKWRTITNETLDAFNARIPERFPYQDDYFYLPVLIQNKHVGGIYARKVMSPALKKQGHVAYINTAGMWSKRSLFGYTQARRRLRNKRHLWIVEGPRDTMKLYQLGEAVVGIIGSYFGEDKARLIETLDPDVLVCATDPDEAGEIAYKNIKKLVKHIPVVRAKFPEDRDPAQLTKRSLRRMKRNLELV